MNNDSQIFTEIPPEQLKKIRTPIITARAIIFSLAGICLLIAIASILMGIYADAKDDATTSSVSFGFVGVLYLLLGILSLKSPFTAILLMSVINTLETISWSLSLLINPEMKNAISWGFLAIQAAMVFFLIRGAIFAKKYKKLTQNV